MQLGLVYIQEQMEMVMSSEWHGGKGSKARKIIDRAKWEENYHRIFGYKDTYKKCDVCGETDGRHTYTCEWYDRDPSKNING